LTVAGQKRFVGKLRSKEAAAIRALKENRGRGRGRLDEQGNGLDWENHRFTHILNKCFTLFVEPLFDHEKLDVYCLELQFVAWIADFFDDVSRCSLQRRRELFEQLDRASLSALLNTAEGNGKRRGRQRAKFFEDARGSASECAACLDAPVAKRFVSKDRVRSGKEMLARPRTRSLTVARQKRFAVGKMAIEGSNPSTKRNRGRGRVRGRGR
jgi:four helix bundle protein